MHTPHFLHNTKLRACKGEWRFLCRRRAATVLLLPGCRHLCGRHHPPDGQPEGLRKLCMQGRTHLLICLHQRSARALHAGKNACAYLPALRLKYPSKQHALRIDMAPDT